MAVPSGTPSRCATPPSWRRSSSPCCAATRFRVAFVDDEERPAIADVTGDFVYARLRRSVMTEATGYPPKSLDAWARRFRTWSAGGEPDDLPRHHPKPAPAKRPRDCFVYFINGAKVRAPAAAQALLQRLRE